MRNWYKFDPIEEKNIRWLNSWRGWLGFIGNEQTCAKWAIEHGQLRFLQELLKKTVLDRSVDVTAEDCELFRLAVQQQQFDIANWLVNNTPTDIHSDEDAALVIAAVNRDYRMFDWLLPGATSRLGTAFQITVFNCDFELSDKMLKLHSIPMNDYGSWVAVDASGTLREFDSWEETSKLYLSKCLDLI